MAAEDVNGEVVLVAESGDPAVSEAGEGWQRSITADYDPSCKLVQFVQCGEEVFGTLEPIEPEEWQQIVDRLGRAAPFMARVLALVQEIERIADGAEPVPDLQRELRAAVKTFAGAIEPEQVVEVAHTADFPRKLDDGWQNFANPDCKSCGGDGIVTGMGGQSRVISPCHDCWPNGQPARTDAGPDPATGVGGKG